MRALVTGGAGFIGSHLANNLVDSGASVVVIDNLSSGSSYNVSTDWNFVEGDVRDENILENLGGEFDVVYHLASHVGQELSFERPHHDFSVNAMGTSQLTEWALQSGKPRIIFASSMNVYGDPLSGNEMVSEAEPLNPPSPYAVAKIASEQLLHVLGAKGLTSCSLRLFNVYGPGQDLENMKQGMVSIFLSYVLRGAPIEVRGRLDRFRDFIHVSDVVNAFVTLGQGESTCGVFNVGSGTKTTVRLLLPSILEAMGEDPSTYPIVEAAGTIRDQFGVISDSTRLRNLGWQAQISLDTGLRQMSAWAKGSRFAKLNL